MRQANGDELPVFVYGTLRQGQRNHRLLAGRIQGGYAALLPDHVMYRPDHGRWPYVADRTGSMVVGELVVPLRTLYAEVLADLDVLEEYRPDAEDSHYLRVVRPVRVVRGGVWSSVTAWVYHAGPATLAGLTVAQEVPSGDWLALGTRRF